MIISLKSCEVQVSGVWAVPLHELVPNPSWWPRATILYLDPIGVWTNDLASKKFPEIPKMHKKSIFWVLVALQCHFIASKDKILYTLMKKLY